MADAKSSGLGRAKRVALHAWILWLLLGLLSSNLESGAFDKLVEPYTGRPFAALGLRQYWAMFAPNPVHNGRFVKWTHVALDGTRTVLQEPAEPPFPPGSSPWMGIGYSRQYKWDKQVALKSERFGKPTAEALCRLNEFEGSMELTIVAYTTPSPAQRRAGSPITRKESVMGPWECP